MYFIVFSPVRECVVPSDLLFRGSSWDDSHPLNLRNQDAQRADIRSKNAFIRRVARPVPAFMQWQK